MRTTTFTEKYRPMIMQLPYEEKLQLIEMVVLSMRSTSKPTESKEDLLAKVAGGWNDNGKTAAEDIAEIYSARQSGVTRNINLL